MEFEDYKIGDEVEYAFRGTIVTKEESDVCKRILIDNGPNQLWVRVDERLKKLRDGWYKPKED